MIQLIVDNTQLDIAADSRVRVEKARSRESSSIESEKTFSADIPNSPRNRKKLGMLGYTDASINFERKVAILQKNHQTVIEGLLRINSATEKKLSYQIDSNFSELKRRLQGKRLPDAVRGITQNIGTYQNTAYKYYSINFPISFLNLTLELRLNGVTIATALLQDPKRNENLARQAQESPHNLGFRFEVSGFSLYALPPNDGNTDTILIYDVISTNNTNASTIFERELVVSDYDFDDFVFPRMRNEKFFGNTVFSGNINEWNNTAGKFRTNSLKLDTTQNQYILIPMLRLKYVLDKVFELIEYTWSGFFDLDELDELIVYNTFSQSKARQGFQKQRPLPFDEWYNIVEYEYHLPDIDIETFLLRLSYNFNLEINVVSTHLTFSQRISSITSPIRTIDAPISIQKETYEPRKNFTLTYQDNAEGFFQSYQYTDPNSSQDEQITLPISSLRYDSTHDAVDDREGSSRLFTNFVEISPAPPLFLEKPIRREMPLRLLFWRGLINNQPTATAKPNAAWDYNFLLGDPKGIRQFWDLWFQFLNTTRTISAKIWLDAYQISEFNIYENFQIGHRRYYPLKLGADLENSKIQRASTFEAYIINT